MDRPPQDPDFKIIEASGIIWMENRTEDSQHPKKKAGELLRGSKEA